MARRRGREDVGAFVKRRAGADFGVFAFEAAGLGWLREAHEQHQGVPIPWVRDFDRNHLTLDFVATTAPSPEAARVFGERILRSGDTDQQRMTSAFELVLCRKPTVAERKIVVGLLARARQHYEADTEAAGQFLRVGRFPTDKSLDPVDVATWGALGSLLLNSDEALTRE